MSIPGNPYIRNAEYIDRAPEIRAIDATLALAHEQRTANLIAYQANVERSYQNTLTRARSGQANELNRQIIERLGLA
jgi:hypothetical protein